MALTGEELAWEAWRAFGVWQSEAEALLSDVDVDDVSQSEWTEYYGRGLTPKQAAQATRDHP